MSKAFDDYSSFRIETVRPRITPKRRRFNLPLLLLLIVGWALLIGALANAGSLTTFRTNDIPTQLPRLNR